MATHIIGKAEFVRVGVVGGVSEGESGSLIILDALRGYARQIDAGGLDMPMDFVLAGFEGVTSTVKRLSDR